MSRPSEWRLPGRQTGILITPSRRLLKVSGTAETPGLGPAFRTSIFF